METVTPLPATTSSGNEALLWIGPDDRGVELEIVVAVLTESYLVVHVMPTVPRS